MLRLTNFTRHSEQHFFESLVLCSIFSSRHVAPGDFLGALDDEELTRHQLVSVTHCIAVVM